MGCCACCMNEDAKVEAVLRRIPAAPASQIQPGEVKFAVGRVSLLQQAITAPVSKKPCAYYEMYIERLETRHHTDADGHTHTTREWVRIHNEKKSVDFMLIDPAGSAVYVPATTGDIKVRCQMDGQHHTMERGAGGGFFDSFFSRPEPLRYIEGQLEMNEQVGVLGMASPGHIQGVPITIMNACKSTDLNEDYFKTHDWSGRDIKCWNVLTQVPSLICTDDQNLMGGIMIPMPTPGYSPNSLAMTQQQFANYGQQHMMQQPQQVYGMQPLPQQQQQQQPQQQYGGMPQLQMGQQPQQYGMQQQQQQQQQMHGMPPQQQYQQYGMQQQQQQQQYQHQQQGQVPMMTNQQGSINQNQVMPMNLQMTEQPQQQQQQPQQQFQYHQAQ